MNDLQKVILNIYKEVKKICDKYNIVYFAIGGTCLGAVRHNGFIPWDDDIDIAIPIELVDVFLEVMEKELPEYLNIRTGYNDSKSNLLFIKIEDIRTTFIENIEIAEGKNYKGVFLDVMPMGGIPTEKRERDILIRRLRVLSSFNTNRRRYRFKECVTLKSKVFWIIFRPISCIVPYDYFLKRYWSILKENPFYTSKFVGYTWSRSLRRLIFHKEYFENVVEMPFEDTTMNCPIKWDKYLLEQFGDYMKLPAVEDRVSGHVGIIDLETSYKEYQLYPEKLRKD